MSQDITNAAVTTTTPIVRVHLVISGLFTSRDPDR